MPRIRKLNANESGSVMVTTALLLVPILLLLGAVFDFGAAFNAQNEYQRRLDSIVLSAAHGYMANSGKSERDIRKAVERILTNHLKAMERDVEANHSFTYRYKVDVKKKTVEVKGKVVVKARLVSLGGHDQADVRLRSKAKATLESQPVCILALGRNRSVGIEFNGDGTVKAKNCVIWSDADSAESIKFIGRGKVESELLCAVGRSGSVGQYKVKPGPQSDCRMVEDPLRKWRPPAVGVCTHESTEWIRTDVARLDPGVYCGGLRVDAKDIRLKSGIYIIKDGPLILRGKTKIKGKGIGIYLTGAGAFLDIDGKSVVELLASERGEMAGIAIAGDSETGDMGQSIITGRSDLKIGGVVYLPNHHLVYRGESDTWAASPVTTIIADSIEIGGKAYLEVKNDKKKAKYAPVIEISKGTVVIVN